MGYGEQNLRALLQPHTSPPTMRVCVCVFACTHTHTLRLNLDSVIVLQFFDSGAHQIS